MKIYNVVIFVIEEDLSIQQELFRLLSSLNYPAKTFASGEEFLNFWNRESEISGVAICNLHLSRMNGLELQEALQQSARPLPLIFISVLPDVLASVTAIKRGAVNVLVLPVDSAALQKALSEACSELSAAEMHHDQKKNGQVLYEKLTPREREVFELAANGYLNKQIAARLGIAEKTVKIHRSRVVSKLELNSIAHLVQFYLQLQPPSVFELGEESA